MLEGGEGVRVRGRGRGRRRGRGGDTKFVKKSEEANFDKVAKKEEEEEEEEDSEDELYCDPGPDEPIVPTGKSGKWPENGVYVCEEDDKCSDIARLYGVNLDRLVQMNKRRYEGLNKVCKVCYPLEWNPKKYETTWEISFGDWHRRTRF